MRKLIFPAESYTLTPIKETGKKFLKCDESYVGLLELFWSVLNISDVQLDKKEHKTNKRLKAAIKLITRHKDEDKDARVANEGDQELIIEEDQYELAKKLLEGTKLIPKISEQITDLWDIIDKAESFTPTPTLVKDEPKPN